MSRSWPPTSACREGFPSWSAGRAGLTCATLPGPRKERACRPRNFPERSVARVSSRKNTSSCSSRIYHSSSVSFGVVSPFVLREPMRRLGVRVVV